jgi:hypothetical protein
MRDDGHVCWLAGFAFNSELNEVHGFLAIPMYGSEQGGTRQNLHVSLPDFVRQQIRQRIHTRHFGDEPPDPDGLR